MSGPAEPAHDRGLTHTASTMHRVDGYAPIDAYAAIGDGRSLAFATDGSIDWLCLPELDAASVFGTLLDPAAGGGFSLSPTVPYGSKVLRRTDQRSGDDVSYRRRRGQSYRRAEPTGGRGHSGSELVRRVDGLAGAVGMQWRVEPRFDYGRQTATMSVRRCLHILRRTQAPAGLNAGTRGGSPSPTAL